MRLDTTILYFLRFTGSLACWPCILSSPTQIYHFEPLSIDGVAAWGFDFSLIQYNYITYNDPFY